MDEGKLLAAFMAIQAFTGCSFMKPVPPAPSIQYPTIDARLTVPCPSMYSQLPVDLTDFNAVMDAHTADVQQAETCRCRFNALIHTVAPQTGVEECPATTIAKPQAAPQAQR